MWKFIQASFGLGFMICAYFIGPQFKIVLAGRATQGVIMGHKETSLTNITGPSRHTFQPIVQINVKGKTYQFKNYYGSSSSGGKGDTVPVLYDEENPEMAMIDQGWRNYIPWGPMFLIGLLAFMGALDRRNGVIIVPKGPATIEEAHRLALEGQWISALKVYRKATGAGLKKAKDYLEQYLKSQK